jgi:CRISPR-associated exonuclease Cas4
MATQKKAAISLPDVPLLKAEQREDGIWVDDDGVPLPVSASDLERHGYCPLSWYLAKAGFDAEGDAIVLGKVQHTAIHEQVVEYRRKERQAKREMVVWSWWFAILITFVVDASAFFTIDQRSFDVEVVTKLARYLVLLALVWLVMALAMLILPWRRLFGKPFGFAQPPNLPPFLQMSGGLDVGREEGWMTGGRVEVWLLLGAVTIAVHGLALQLVTDLGLGTFVMLLVAILWTLIAAWQLQRGLLATDEADEAAEVVGIDRSKEFITYSDDEDTAGLLIDKETGLRGRPDQIISVNNQFIPVEQKTGKTPIEPHFSHKIQILAYLRLVNIASEIRPSYGLLSYGMMKQMFTVSWGESEEKLLLNQIKEVQQLMVEGGAHRNHERVGKCMNCSRRLGCPEALTPN